MRYETSYNDDTTGRDLDSSGYVIIPEAMHREACTKPYQFNGHIQVYTKRYVI